MTPATLDRRELLPKLFPNQQDQLFISGLAGPARDTAALCDDGANLFTMAGTMGAATSMGLGVAISAPNRNVVVIAGDGEMLMNIGSLVTVATIAPENLTIVCIDNGCHGETGGQTGHTSNNTNLETMAKGAGIASTMTVETEQDVATAADFINTSPGPRFILLRVMAGPPTVYKRNINMTECRARFRDAFFGAT